MIIVAVVDVVVVDVVVSIIITTDVAVVHQAVKMFIAIVFLKKITYS